MNIKTHVIVLVRRLEIIRLWIESWNLTCLRFLFDIEICFGYEANRLNKIGSGILNNFYSEIILVLKNFIRR